jgi:hypothetical protein
MLSYQTTQKQTELWKFVNKLRFFHYQLHEFENRQICRLRDDYKQTKHWNQETKQTFIETIIRQTPTPNIIVREIQENNHIVWQILDGYKRITTIQEFLMGNIHFPLSFKDMPEFAQYTPTTNIDIFNDKCDTYNIILHTTPKNYTHLSESHKNYCKHLSIGVSIVTGISNTQNQNHEIIAKTLFEQLHIQNN